MFCVDIRINSQFEMLSKLYITNVAWIRKYLLLNAVSLGCQSDRC